MAETPAPGSKLPRWLRYCTYPFGAVLLTLFFVYLGFPYGLLVARYLPQIESASSTRVRLGDVDAHLSLFGPGLEMMNVLASREDARPVALDRVFVRPAWSTSWLTGEPALHVDLAGAAGKGQGTITLGPAAGFAGVLEDLDVASLPLAMISDFELAGMLDADIDLHRRPEDAGGGLVGLVAFGLADGSIAAPGLPMPVPFETLGGDLRFGEGDSLVLVEGVTLEGKLLAAQVDGQILAGRSPGREPLDLAVRYEIRNPMVASLFGGRSDKSQIKITGTMQQPIVR